MKLTFIEGNLTNPDVIKLLQEHLHDMEITSPPESRHALNLDGLKATSVTFWSAWYDAELKGCCAMKELDAQHGELKSMRTATSARKAGIGSIMLEFLIEQAKSRGYKKLSLETGTQPLFFPAHGLYEKYGFNECEPFADYVLDPYSRFYTKELD